MKNTYRTFLFILSLISFLVLTACGGGGGDTLPPGDTTPPTIQGTLPVSGTITTTNVDLRIFFNEAIKVPELSNIDIYPYKTDGSLDKAGRVKLTTSNPFTVNPTTHELIIRPTTSTTNTPNAINPHTKYHVYVHGIQDREGNSMADCRWEFATEIYNGSIAKGTSSCNTNKPTELNGSFEFAQANSNVSELVDIDNATPNNTTLLLNRVGGSDGTVSVTYNMIAGSATAGSDYTEESNTVTFTNGQTQKQILVLIIDDAILDEGSETFAVSLVPGSATGGAVIGSKSSHEITISENDFSQPQAGTFSFSLPITSEADERIGTHNITVVRTLGGAGTVTVTFAETHTETNTQGTVDFTLPATKTLIFGPNEQIKTIPISIVDDQLVEKPERFEITLVGAVGDLSVAAPVIATSNITHTVTIISDDTFNPGEISFVKPSSKVDEDNGTPSPVKSAPIIVQRINGTDGELTVTYSTTIRPVSTPGFADANDITQIPSGTLTFPAGAARNTQTISVLITFDEIEEPDETFTVNLKTVTVTGGVATIDKARNLHTVTILANDKVITPTSKIQFKAITSSFSEAAGTTSIIVERTGDTGVAQTINYSTSPGTGVANINYEPAINVPLTFVIGETSKPISIVIIDDKAQAGNKTFSVNLSSTPAGLLGANTTNTVTIQDVGVPRALTTAELVAIWSLLL